MVPVPPYVVEALRHWADVMAQARRPMPTGVFMSDASIRSLPWLDTAYALTQARKGRGEGVRLA